MIFDEQEGWIISSTGGIWHTENSGGTWLGSDYPNVISRGLHGLFFSDIARFPGNTIHEI